MPKRGPSYSLNKYSLMNSTQNMNNKLNQKLQGQKTHRTEPSKSLGLRHLRTQPETFTQERPSLRRGPRSGDALAQGRRSLRRGPRSGDALAQEMPSLRRCPRSGEALAQGTPSLRGRPRSGEALAQGLLSLISNAVLSSISQPTIKPIKSRYGYAGTHGYNKDLTTT